jgi:hypothetical protein
MGAVDILARVWKREGFVGWYQVSKIFLVTYYHLRVFQGMQAQITKAVLSQALLFMSKEQFEHWTLSIIIITARFSTRQQ